MLPEFPHRNVPLQWRGGPRLAGALELAAPLALGQRGLIVAPARSGASTVLRWFGAAVAAAVPDATIHALLVDRPVEERLDWREELPSAVVFGTDSDSDGGAAAHAATLEHVTAASQLALAGSDVLLLIDSLGSLARALAATSDAADDRVLDGGLPHTTLVELRQLFGLARTGSVDGGSGSLTIIATVQTGTSQRLDEVLLHELVGTGNVEWHLHEESMRAGLFPPVDVAESGARNVEQIIGADAADRRAVLRGQIDDLGPVAGLGLLLDGLDRAGSLDALLDELNPGDSDAGSPLG